jgi:hypothetical protein
MAFSHEMALGATVSSSYFRVFPTRLTKGAPMSFLIVFLIVVGGSYRLGHYAGEHREKDRHGRAVSEATTNITSMTEWKR